MTIVAEASLRVVWGLLLPGILGVFHWGPAPVLILMSQQGVP